MRKATLLTLTLLTLPTVAMGDEVILTDGTRLVGQLEQLAYDKLKIKTDVVGEVTVPAAKVKGVVTTAPLIVQFKDGERSLGPLQYTAEGGENVNGATPRKVDLGQVEAMWPAAAESPEVQAAKAKSLAEGWKYHAAIGLSGETGPTELFTVNGDLEANRRTANDYLHLYASGQYARQRGQTSAAEVEGGMLFENNITPKFYWFLHGEMEHNDAQDLDLRTTIAGGLGYYLIKEDHQMFKVHAGPGYEHRTYRHGMDTDQAVLELGENYQVDVVPWFTFVHAFTYYPSLEEPLQSYRMELDDHGEIPISPDRMWKLELGMTNKYLEPSPTTRLDTIYYLRLAVDFK